MLNKGIVALLISSLFVNYALSAVASDCTTAGDYLDNTATCSACPANKYCPGYPTSQTAAAINCPAGTQTASGTTVGQDALSDCSACAAGSYSAPGTACTTAQCPTHNYCPVTGSRDGGTTPNTATVITKCPAGTQTGGAALSNCAACSAGSYSAQGTACSTDQCIVNNYCPVTGSRDGGTTPNTATILSPCDAGKSSPAGSDESADCTNCAAGTYGDTSGAGCKDCPVGSYCTGGSVKTTCPSGTTSDAKAKAQTDCKTSSGSKLVISSSALLGVVALGYLTI